MADYKYLRKTPCGEICGVDTKLDNVVAYKGIRFANAQRWKYPEIVTHWDGVYEATKYGNCCYQPRSFYDEEKVPEKAFYYNEFRKGETYTYSEDCLFLNIWTPKDADENSKLPVIFYIHGGGFTGGCGHEKHFDGPKWPTKGCVAVTINYRLGPLGFMCLKELEEESGHTGNYALYDQLTALKWVRDNIASFGGDKDNITIMGQSAGAMSVQQLCLTPLAKGMIAKAVMSSGGGVSKMLVCKPASEQFSFWNSVKEKAGCSDLESFRALDVAKLYEAQDAAKKELGKKAMIGGPVLDGTFISKTGPEVTEAGEQLHIPYMLGSTSEDMMPPILYQMVLDWGKLEVKQKAPNCYGWFFERQLPGDDNGAWHSSDLWYWFGTLENGWRPFTEEDKKLSEQMVDYLTNFAKSGDPNGDGLPTWVPFGEKQDEVLHLSENVHMGSVSKAKLTLTMMTNKAVGE